MGLCFGRYRRAFPTERSDNERGTFCKVKVTCARRVRQRLIINDIRRDY